ncbi:unnamed protein product [Amoebophrya sp. A120]|nr:unnamed protein product [Amoebophrya sp. A120]|eukprot:GSA120T00019468001.1
MMIRFGAKHFPFCLTDALAVLLSRPCVLARLASPKVGSPSKKSVFAQLAALQDTSSESEGEDDPAEAQKKPIPARHEEHPRAALDESEDVGDAAGTAPAAAARPEVPPDPPSPALPDASTTQGPGSTSQELSSSLFHLRGTGKAARWSDDPGPGWERMEVDAGIKNIAEPARTPPFFFASRTTSADQDVLDQAAGEFGSAESATCGSPMDSSQGTTAATPESTDGGKGKPGEQTAHHVAARAGEAKTAGALLAARAKNNNRREQQLRQPVFYPGVAMDGAAPTNFAGPYPCMFSPPNFDYGGGTMPNGMGWAGFDGTSCGPGNYFDPQQQFQVPIVGYFPQQLYEPVPNAPGSWVWRPVQETNGSTTTPKAVVAIKLTDKSGPTDEETGILAASSSDDGSSAYDVSPMCADKKDGATRRDSVSSPEGGTGVPPWSTSAIPGETTEGAGAKRPQEGRKRQEVEAEVPSPRREEVVQNDLERSRYFRKENEAAGQAHTGPASGCVTPGGTGGPAPQDRGLLLAGPGAAPYYYYPHCHWGNTGHFLVPYPYAHTAIFRTPVPWSSKRGGQQQGAKASARKGKTKPSGGYFPSRTRLEALRAFQSGDANAAPPGTPKTEEKLPEGHALEDFFKSDEEIRAQRKALLSKNSRGAASDVGGHRPSSPSDSNSRGTSGDGKDKEWQLRRQIIAWQEAVNEDNKRRDAQAMFLHPGGRAGTNFANTESILQGTSADKKGPRSQHGRLDVTHRGWHRDFARTWYGGGKGPTLAGEGPAQNFDLAKPKANFPTPEPTVSSMPFRIGKKKGVPSSASSSSGSTAAGASGSGGATPGYFFGTGLGAAGSAAPARDLRKPVGVWAKEMA